MNGSAIGAQAIGDAGLRQLATEHGGPRPAGVRPDERAVAVAEMRTTRATKP